MNMVMLDKIQDELIMDSLITPVPGSMGQLKNEVSPLLPHYDKTQQPLMQFEVPGLNYSNPKQGEGRHQEGWTLRRRPEQPAQSGTR